MALFQEPYNILQSYGRNEIFFRSSPPELFLWKGVLKIQQSTQSEVWFSVQYYKNQSSACSFVNLMEFLKHFFIVIFAVNLGNLDVIKSYLECFCVHLQKFPEILMICQTKIAHDAIVGSFIWLFEKPLPCLNSLFLFTCF